MDNTQELYRHKYQKYKLKYRQQLEYNSQNNQSSDVQGGFINMKDISNKVVDMLTDENISKLNNLYRKADEATKNTIDENIDMLLKNKSDEGEYCDKKTYKEWEKHIEKTYCLEYINHYNTFVMNRGPLIDDTQKLFFSRKQKDIVMLYPHGKYYTKYNFYHVGRQCNDVVKLKYKSIPLEFIDRLPALDLGGLTSISTSEFSLDTNNKNKLYSIVETIIVESSSSTIYEFINKVFSSKLSDDSIKKLSESIAKSFETSNIECVQLFHLQTNKNSPLQYYQFIIPQNVIKSKTNNYYVRNFTGNDENYGIIVKNPNQFHLSYSYDFNKKQSHIVPNLNINNINHEYNYF